MLGLRPLTQEAEAFSPGAGQAPLRISSRKELLVRRRWNVCRTGNAVVKYGTENESGFRKAALVKESN